MSDKRKITQVDETKCNLRDALTAVKKFIYRTDNQELKGRAGTLYAQVFPTDEEEPHTKITDLLQWFHRYYPLEVKSNKDVYEVFRIAREHLRDLEFESRNVLIRGIGARVDWAIKSMDKIEALLKEEAE
ncbi:MAG: hypothetical protein OXC80_06730 [Gammaproteobacteria bacterium]|nr:hypothetical protein [Gammaproteobacteria bacterium]